MDSDASTDRSYVASWRQVRCVRRRLLTLMSISSSRRTTRCCVTSPTDSHRHVLFGVVRGVPRCRPGRPTPWIDAEYGAVRRDCRRLERLYRRSGRPDARLAWVQATRHRFRIYREKEEAYTGLIVSRSAVSHRRFSGAGCRPDSTPTCLLYTSDAADE